jgi:hypothetical protein
MTDDDTQYDEAQVQAMIKKAVLEEREACARLCDLMNAHGWKSAFRCAIEIRARGDNGTQG